MAPHLPTSATSPNPSKVALLSKRFELDVYYVDHLSFFMDVKILWMTFTNLFKSKVVVDRADLEGVDDLGFDKIAFNEDHK